jgi:hypothetical protein
MSSNALPVYNFSELKYRVSEVLPSKRKHPLLINLKFSKNSGMIVYHCRTACKNFKIFNETGKDFGNCSL